MSFLREQFFILFWDSEFKNVWKGIILRERFLKCILWKSIFKNVFFDRAILIIFLRCVFWVCIIEYEYENV